VHTGAHKNKDQRRDDRIGNADLRLQLFCVLGVTLVDPLKELLAVFNVLGQGVNLVHQAVFFAVFFGGPVGNFLKKPHHIFWVCGSHGQKVVLHLGHTVGGGVDNQLVQILKINIQVGFGAAAGFCQRLGAGSG